MFTKTDMPRGAKRFGFDDTIDYSLASSVEFFTFFGRDGLDYTVLFVVSSSLLERVASCFFTDCRSTCSRERYSQVAACCVGVWRVGGQ